MEDYLIFLSAQGKVVIQQIDDRADFLEKIDEEDGKYMGMTFLTEPENDDDHFLLGQTECVLVRGNVMIPVATKRYELQDADDVRWNKKED